MQYTKLKYYLRFSPLSSDGSVLASYGQVIVVTLNYRLGILGKYKRIKQNALFSDTKFSYDIQRLILYQKTMLLPTIFPLKFIYIVILIRFCFEKFHVIVNVMENLCSINILMKYMDGRHQYVWQPTTLLTI